jgi:protein dithiol oxidoreductase (disulfide-forming)
MKHALAVVALLGLGLAACGREPPPSTLEQTSLEAPAPTAPTGANASDTAAAPAALEQAATRNQETTPEAEADRGDARLERVAALPESAQLPSGKWKPGTNYLPLSPAQPTSVEPGQVEVLEVFWYGCPHCYALDPFLENWKKTKPSYVKFVRVPVTWGPVHRSHGRLFYTLEALGKLDELHSKAFDEIHQRGNMLAANDEATTLRLQAAFARANGISEADFTKAYNSFGVNAAMQRAEEITRRYRIEGVPVLFVNGKYQTDVSMAGGQPQPLIELLTDLAAAEKRR